MYGGEWLRRQLTAATIPTVSSFVRKKQQQQATTLTAINT